MPVYIKRSTADQHDDDDLPGTRISLASEKMNQTRSAANLFVSRQTVTSICCNDKPSSVPRFSSGDGPNVRVTSEAGKHMPALDLLSVRIYTGADGFLPYSIEGREKLDVVYRSTH